MKIERITSALLVTLVVMCFSMVTLGGYVRVSGSGLSIPEWPFFTVDRTVDATGAVVRERQSIFPPTTDEGWEVLRNIFVEEMTIAGKTQYLQGAELDIAPFKRMFWIEWSHRALAKTIGVVYLVFLAVALLNGSIRRRIGLLAVGGLFLLASQAVIGGILVWLHLIPIKLATHLTTAFLFTSLVVWMLMRMVHPPVPSQERPRHGIGRWAIAVYGLIGVQIFLGGLVAGGGSAHYAFSTWPLMGEYLVPPGMWTEGDGLYRNLTENIVLIQFLHRWFAFAVAAAILLFTMRCLTVKTSAAGRWALRLLFAVVTFQIVLGILTLLFGGHAHLALTHQSFGLVLFLNALVVVYETTRHPVLTEVAVAEMREGTARAAAPPAPSGKAVRHA